MAKIIIIGPGHPYRGGIATFNNRLAKAFIDEGHECAIWSFSLQYPSFLFPGKTQYGEGPAPEGIPIYSKINSIHPLNWISVGNQIKKEKPDIVVVRYWLPLMGPALGTILRRIRKNRHTKIICIADNVIPHEKRPGDKAFTRYFVASCDAFITMSAKVMEDLRHFNRDKPAVLVPHPLYDNFGETISKEEARKQLHLPQSGKIALFFGFIRKYKGLDILLRAMKLLEMPDVKLLVAGEFYEDEKTYQELIAELGIANQLILKTHFISDEEVKYYLCAVDVLVQPYRSATQSGVTPLAYYFEKPTIVTDVGGLASLVPHEQCGLVTQPDPASIAGAITRFYALGENHFVPFIRAEKKKYAWETMVGAIRELAEGI